MRKRTAIRIISYLAALAVCLTAGLIMADRRADIAARELRYQGEQAFTELCDSVSNMDAALQKSLYAVTPGMTATICAEVYSRAQAADHALCSLPFSIQELEQTSTFLAKAGDYAAYLLRRSGGGEDVTEEERENLRLLSQSAALLHENLTQLRTDMADGMISADAGQALEAGLPSLSDSFLQMEQEFPEIPTLVYDGPFSSSIADRTPRMTENGKEISADDALLVVSGFLDVRSNLAAGEGPTEGKIPAWRVIAGDYTVSVSKKGGYVIRAISSRVPTRTVLSTDDGVKAAKDFLRARKYQGMAESYHVLEDNVLTVTFCAKQNGVICYPDMIKVAVAMDDGTVLRFDATAYLTSHMTRDLPAAEMTGEEAAEKVPASLKLISQRLAVVPSLGEEEVFCRELTCETEEGQHCLLYFNAVTGAQEKILLLLEDETGTLAI